MDIILGIGNTLRGDDGAGPCVVEALLPRADLQVMTVHQLTPELAETIRDADRVLFVDACVDGSAVALTRIEPAMHRGLGHACSPQALLGWTEFVFDRAPDAWLLRIPAHDFGPGEQLSERTQRALPEALAAIEEWSAVRTALACAKNEEEA